MEADLMDADPMDAEAENAYRELSTASVASVVVALVSPVALFGGVLAVVPVAAVALGLVAVRWVAADPRGRSGRALALVGANLGVVVLAMTGAKAVAEPLILQRQARLCAEAWFDRVRSGDLEAAVAISRLPEADPSATRPPAITEVWPAVEWIRGLDEWPGGVRLEETLDCRPLTAGAWQVDQRYSLVGTGEPRREALLRLVRLRAGRITTARWLVTHIEAADPAAEP